MKGLVVLLMMSVFFVSCGHKKNAKAFEKILEAETGQDHSVAKLRTEKGKYVVFKNNVTGEYSAYNMKKFDRKDMGTYSEFLANATVGVDVVNNLTQNKEWVEDGYTEYVYETDYYYYEYYDEDCECWVEDWYEDTYVVDSYWVDTSYWYYYYTGGGFRFSSTTDRSKDLETLAALKEDIAEKFVAQTLSSQYSLSANRASEMAKMVTRYQKLESSRELTSEEKDIFALDALGVSYNQIENAIKAKAQGEEASYQDLLKKAAEVNNVTPEQIGKVFEDFVGEEAL